MSGLFEKKVERDVRRQERVDKEMRDKKKTRTVAIIVTAVLLVVFAAAIFVNSAYARRTLTAISFNGTNFSSAEYDYFYASTVEEYTNFVNESGGGSLPADDRPHSSQIYDGSTGETWADFFHGMTQSRLSEMVAMYTAANNDPNYTLPAEEYETIDQSIDSIKQSAAFSNVSFNRFVEFSFGAPLNEKSLREVLEFVSIVYDYRDYRFNALTYTPEQTEARYLELEDDYDQFTYRTLFIGINDVYDFEPTESFFDAEEPAMDALRDAAEEFVYYIDIEEDFINSANEFFLYSAMESEFDIEGFEGFDGDDRTLRVESGIELNEAYKDWMLDETREYGDLNTFEVSDDLNSGIHIVYFIERDDNSYHLAEMRQILILRETFAQIEEFGEELDFETQDTMASLKAQTVLTEFELAGHTEEALIEMMETYSDDWTEGGLYTGIYKGMMVPEIDEWLFEEGRAIGDYEMVRTEAFGYHFLYFTGFGETFRSVVGEAELRNADHQEWVDSLERKEPVTHWALILSSY